jgi:hypothetical protein
MRLSVHQTTKQIQNVEIWCLVMTVLPLEVHLLYLHACYLGLGNGVCHISNGSVCRSLLLIITGCVTWRWGRTLSLISLFIPFASPKFRRNLLSNFSVLADRYDIPLCFHFIWLAQISHWKQYINHKAERYRLFSCSRSDVLYVRLMEHKKDILVQVNPGGRWH